MRKEVGSSALSTFSLPIMVLLLLGSFVLPSFNLSRSQAQAASPITPSGLNTQVNLSAAPPAGKTQYDITGGTRPGGGTNLFHSFGDFNVPTNNIANFLNETALPTSNILGRVTGTNGNNPTLSSIFGTIQTTGFGNANLFMMNPAGFLFGPNVTVNVGGMVAFTSADYLRLTDGAHFNAIPNAAADALLSAAPVAAFGFSGSNPGAITVQGSQLSVTPGQSISLVGGNITVQSGVLDDGVTIQPARLSAPGGQINLASVASPGEVLYPGFNYGPNVNGAQFTSLGNITLSDGALVDVSANQAGTVKIRGGQLLIADATVSADTQNANGAPVAIDINIAGDMSIAQTTSAPALTARTTGIGDAGEIRISSSNLTVTSTGADVPTVAIDTHTSGEGRAGNVKITTGNLDVSSSSLVAVAIFIDSGTDGFHNAHGGDVTITATRFNDTPQAIGTGGNLNRIQGGDTDGSSGNLTITANEIQLTGAAISTDVSSFAGTGVAGNIFLDATNITTVGSIVSATGWQQGGAITIHANNLSITNSSSIGNIGLTGPSGAMNITANSIALTNGSTVESDVGGDGNAGPINITAPDHLTLSGNIQDELPGVGIIGRPTGIFSNSFGVFGTNGNAGTITITTPKLMMTDGSRINTSTLTNGSGGDVIINAQSISMSGTLPSIIPEPLFAPGSVHPGGIVTVTTGESCAGPCGNAGNISITTNQFNISGGAQINSGTSSSGHGGTISINARDTIAITGTDSSGLASGVQSLSTGTAVGSGAGGTISLTAGQSVTMSNGAFVSASSIGPGNTGNIQINAGNQFVMANSTVTTEANQASGGTIKISTTPSGTVELINSTISASVLDGTGGGGSVNIDPQFVLLQNSQILANAVQGPGGNISIMTNLLMPDANSVISASSQFGVNGTVTVQSPNAPATGKIIPLSQKPLTATALLSQRCAALAEGELSSFIVAGRDSLPAEPGGWLSSPLAMTTAESTGSPLTEPTSNRAPVGEPAGEAPLLSLRQIAPPGFLTQAFAVDWSGGCKS